MNNMAFSASSASASTKSKDNQVLRKGDQFSAWKVMLQAALSEKDVIGHVFHNIEWEEPVIQPIRNPQESQLDFQAKLKTFMKNDLQAYGIILSRLDTSIRPDFGDTRPSAKVLFETIEATYRPIITVDILQAIRNLTSTRLSGTNTLLYCEHFQTALQQHKIATTQYAQATGCDINRLKLNEVYINILFEMGTIQQEWLRSWRQANRPESKSLEEMITTLRRESPPQSKFINDSLASAAKTKVRDDDEQCQLCNHSHTNAKCFKQHPNRRLGKLNKYQESKFKAKGKEKRSRDKASLAIDPNLDTSGGPDTDSDQGSVAGSAIAASGTKGLSSKSIILDSGTSWHFFNNQGWFQDLHRMEQAVSLSLAIGQSSVTHCGTVTIEIKNKAGKTTRIKLQNCLYSPKSATNLISTGRLNQIAGIHLDSVSNSLLRKGKVIGTTRHFSFVPVLQDVNIIRSESSQQRQVNLPGTLSAPAIAKPRADTQRWHQRLGHIGTQILNATKAKALGLEDIDTSTLGHCEPCKLSKSQRVVSRTPRPIPGLPLDEIHVDTAGPIDPPDFQSNKYIFFLTDSKTRFRWTFMARNKSQGPQIITDFLAKIRNAYGKTPKMLFSDGGGEYINNELTEMAHQQGIRWDVSAPYTPEQNGIAESSSKTITVRARAMLLDSGFPLWMWSFAVQHSCYLTNRLANLTTKAIPIQQLESELHVGTVETIDLSSVRRFGCKAYMHIQNMQKSAKFAPRAHVCWFVGFQEHSSTNYLLWIPWFDGRTQRWEGKTYITPHVTFDEDVTHGRHFQQPPNLSATLPVQEEEIIDIPRNSQGDIDMQDQTPPPQEEHMQEELTHTQTPPFQEEHTRPHTPPSQEEHTQTPLAQEEHIQTSPLQEEHTGPQGHQSPTLEELQDVDTLMTPFLHNPVTGKRKRSPSPVNEPTIRTRSGREVNRRDYKRLHIGANAFIQTLPDPKDHQEALSRPDASYWKAAMIRELNGLESSGTIEWIKKSKLPPGRKPLTGKWVFKTKYLPDGSIEKYKARWTARGFTQKQGIDYINTYAPTPRAATGRIILALSIQYKWKRIQFDVETAFLNPNLDKLIFIQPPDGVDHLVKGKSNMLIKIKKGLYGLKQAANLWHQDAVITIEALGLKRTETDACLFTRKGIIVLMHVDDFQVFSPTMAKAQWFIDAMKKRYTIKIVDTGVFLGLHIKPQGNNQVLISQKHYALEKLKGHNLEKTKDVKYPLDCLLESSKGQCTKEEYGLFNQIIGELQHLSNHTRPDISYAVNHLARFLQNPSQQHINAAKHIWRYIAGTVDKGLLFKRGNNLEMAVYTDSDFMGCPETSRSTSGCLITLAGAPVVWRSQLQKEVVLSSTEAEYLALTECTREVAWMRNLLYELQPFTGEKVNKIKIFVDNQSAIALVKDHTNSRRSRHVSLRNHYCREQYKLGKIEVEYINTTKQLADGLTKPKSPNPLL